MSLIRNRWTYHEYARGWVIEHWDADGEVDQRLDAMSEAQASMSVDYLNEENDELAAARAEAQQLREERDLAQGAEDAIRFRLTETEAENARLRSELGAGK